MSAVRMERRAAPAGGWPDVLAAELLKLRKRPAIWVIAVIAVFLLVVEVYLGTSSQYVQEKALATDNQVPPMFILQGLQPDQVVQAILSQPQQRWYFYALGLVLGALVAGSEYSWGTIKTEASQSPSRLEVYLGQMLAVLSVLAVLSPLVFAGGLTASVITTSRLHGAMLWPSAQMLLEGMGTGLLLFAMPAAMGVMLAALFRSAALAIATGLAWFLILEEGLQLYGFATPLVAAILSWLPRANADALAVNLGQWDAVLQNPPAPLHDTPLHFVIVLLGYVVLFTIIGGLVVRRRDIQ